MGKNNNIKEVKGKISEYTEKLNKLSDDLNSNIKFRDYLRDFLNESIDLIKDKAISNGTIDTYVKNFPEYVGEHPEAKLILGGDLKNRVGHKELKELVDTTKDVVPDIINLQK